MNPLLQNKQVQSNPSLSDFQRSYTPESAKERLNQMLKSGQISESDIHTAINLGKSLGMFK